MVLWLSSKLHSKHKSHFTSFITHSLNFITDTIGFSISFKEGDESAEIDGEGADISHFICMI